MASLVLPTNLQRGKGGTDEQLKGKLLMCKNISHYITFITNKDTQLKLRTLKSARAVHSHV